MSIREEIQEVAEAARMLGLDSNRILRDRGKWQKYILLIRKWGRKIALVSKKELDQGILVHIVDPSQLYP